MYEDTIYLSLSGKETLKGEEEGWRKEGGDYVNVVCGVGCVFCHDAL